MNLTTVSKITFFMIFLLTSFQSFSQSKNQVIFHTMLKEYCTYYDAQNNEIKASEVYTQANRQKKIFAQKLKWNFTNWTGNIVEISTNQGGNWADLTIRSNIENFKISFVDMRILGGGGIRKGSKIYNQISQLKEGSPVIFSGRFLSGKRGIEETSLTEWGSLCGPVFSIKFTNVVFNPKGVESVSLSDDFSGGFLDGFSSTISWSLNHKWWLIAGIILIAIFRALGEADKKKKKKLGH